MALDDDNDENTQLPQQKIVSIYYYFYVGFDIAFEKKMLKNYYPPHKFSIHRHIFLHSAACWITSFRQCDAKNKTSKIEK